MCTINILKYTKLISPIPIHNSIPVQGYEGENEDWRSLPFLELDLSRGINHPITLNHLQINILFCDTPMQQQSSERSGNPGTTINSFIHLNDL